MSVLVISALSLIGLNTACSKSSTQDHTPTIIANQDGGGRDSKSCQDFIAKLPADYIHDFTSVPEDPSDPTSAKIQVFYYGKLIAGVTPVAFFNGGPTSNSWSSYQVLSREQSKNPSYANIPFIYIDQRGTGCSDPYPHVSHLSHIARLALYGSAGIVADSEAIRKTLIGDAPWKIFGQSYGGMIVHRYVVNAPDSIVSATSHGFALTSDAFQTLYDRIDAQKNTVDAYLEKYPADQGLLQSLDLFLTPSQCYTQTGGTSKVCGKQLLNPFYETIGFVDQWPWIHLWLAKLPNPSMQDWVNRVVFNPSSHKNADASWADSVIWHNEMVFAMTDHDTCEAIYALASSKGEHPENWLLDECQPGIDATESKHANPLNALPQNDIAISTFAAALADHPKLAFYLYSGGEDPYSPSSIFSQETAQVPNLTYQNFPNSGHDGFYSEQAVWENLMKN